MHLFSKFFLTRSCSLLVTNLCSNDMTFAPCYFRPQELRSLWRSRGSPPSFVCVLRGAAGRRAWNPSGKQK